MKNKLSNYFEKLKIELTHEESRTRIQFECVFIIFFILSVVMTLINITTGFKLLMWSTLIFSILNLINFVLAIFRGKFATISRLLFSIEMIGLLTLFLIVGEPEGFSILWSALLPVGGMMLYGRKKASLLSLIQFVIILFFCWIPYGKDLLMYEYTNSFLLRFPVLFIAFFIVGFIFESILEFIQGELITSRNKYEALSYIDQLTGLGNENKYFDIVNTLEEEIKSGNANFGIIVLDVNELKATNDKYGHRYGCSLVVKTGEILPHIFKESEICHVGGDEFVVFLKNDDLKNSNKLLKELRYEISYSKTMYEGIELIYSVASGIAFYGPNDTFKSVFERADKDMYQNKKELKEEYGLSGR